VREKFHSSVLVEHLTLINPQVQARLQSSSASYASAIADPSARTNLGIRSIASMATREANILAYNDVFMLIALVAVLTMLWISLRVTWLKMTTRPIAGFTPAPANSTPVTSSSTPSATSSGAQSS